ncbi:hypothetical protein IBX73_07365 [candidate division WOR-3 bacterium]|nr:hypothetical protein [candidate division WOR-3 bacterium]
MAFDGVNYLVVWYDYDGGTDSAIYGTRVTPDGVVLDPEAIPISVASGYQFFPAVAFDGRYYVVTWHDHRSGNYDIYGARVTTEGTVLEPSGFALTSELERTIYPDIVASGAGQNLIAWQTDRVPETFDIYGSQFYTFRSTDDPLALAYNGNRHLVREPNTEILHLVYTRRGQIIYEYSSDGGNDWALPEIVGEGMFPAIALDCASLPSITWTDAEGGLWYRRKTSPTIWSDICHLDDPTSPGDRHLNSPPAIAIDLVSRPNTVHILVTRSGVFHHTNIPIHTRLRISRFPLIIPARAGLT